VDVLFEKVSLVLACEGGQFTCTLVPKISFKVYSTLRGDMATTDPHHNLGKNDDNNIPANFAGR